MARPGHNLLIIFAASIAEAEVDAAAAARADLNNAMWGSLAGGGGIGVVVGLLWWAGVAQWCKSGQATCIEHGWFNQVINGFDIAFLIAATVGAFALLVSVHQQTTRGI